MAGLEGRTLDRYELRQMIGKGGMADVYLGYDARFERIVAVKVFKRDDDELLMRFIREARLMASLRHPHLMPVYDAGDSILDGVVRYYIVMPFMEGGTLRGRIRSTPLSLQETCRYLRQIADALDYIHQRGIIHRDIKSSNILLDAEDRCYLSDFGIARTVTDATMTTTGGVLGTVDYVAPELFEAERKADAYSDLYSLGVLAFEAVTGRLPFAAESQIALVAMHINKLPPSPRSLAPDLSVRTEQVMLKALAKRPEWRYESASAFAEMFCQSLTVRSETNGPSRMTRIESPYDTEVAAASSLLANAPEAVRPMPSARSTEGHLQAIDGGSFSQVPAYQSQAMTTQRKKRSSSARIRGVVVGILALLALLAVIGPMVFASLVIRQEGHHPVTPSITHTVVTQVQPTATTIPTLAPTPNLTATTHAITATAVQQVHQATVTAIARQTATVQAQASATAGVIQTATAGNATYSDALNNANAPATGQANWDQNGNCVFKGDGYHVSAKEVLGRGQFKGCMESGYSSYTNTTISVDMTILGGHAGGVFFRMNTDLFHNYAGYLFALDSQGNYTFSRSSNFSSGDVPLKEGIVASGFRAGYNVKNTLQIVANGSSLSFYVNGIFLDKEEEATFTSGSIAFFASTSGSSTDADVAYSNVRVFTIA